MDVSPLGFEVGVTPLDDHLAAEIHLQPHFIDLPKAVCGTGDSFETGQPKVACDVVDMEGYALAKVCHKLGVRLISVKYITDGADDTAHLDWEEKFIVRRSETPSPLSKPFLKRSANLPIFFLAR